MPQPHHQLLLVEHSLHLTSKAKSELVAFTPRGLAFSSRATDEDVLEIGRRIFAIRGQTKWMLGSLFAEMMKRRPAEAGSTQDYDVGWAAEFAAAHDLDPKERREMMGVFTFYAPCESTPGPLSYEHHREAMWGVNDGRPQQLTRALAFLTRAASEGLSVTQLRMLIREQGRTTTTPAPDQLDLASYSVVFDFMRYAKRELQAVHTYTPERARMVLHDLGGEAFLAYADALRARAAADAHASPARGAPLNGSHVRANGELRAGVGGR